MDFYESYPIFGCSIAFTAYRSTHPSNKTICQKTIAKKNHSKCITVAF